MNIEFPIWCYLKISPDSEPPSWCRLCENLSSKAISSNENVTIDQSTHIKNQYCDESRNNEPSFQYCVFSFLFW